MKHLNPFLILIFIILILFASCEKEEIPQVTKGILTYESNPSNIRRNCSSLFFTSKNVGYATTEGGIYKTTDGGKKWNNLGVSSPVKLRTSCFVNEDEGYVFGGESGCSPMPCNPFGSIVYVTKNGGKTWQIPNIPGEKSELYSAFFINENVGFAVGKGLCLKTTTGGQTWNQFTIADKNVCEKISFTSQNIGYALNLGGLYKTSNGGVSWEDISINGEKLTFNFFFLNDTLGYANVLDNIYKTNDGGENWILIDNINGSIKLIYFINEEIGITLSQRYLYFSSYAGPMRHSIRLTKDGGKNWTTIEYEEEKLNERCLFAKDNIIYSLGYDRIFKLVIE